MMKYFTKKEYQHIADLYKLGKIIKLEKLYIGYGGSAKVSVQTDLGQYVISKDTISSEKGIVGKTKASLKYEIEMLKTVQTMPVPRYVLSKKGKYIEKFNNSFVTVYHYLDGSTPEKITSSMAYQLGKFFGEFHKRSRSFKKELKSRRKYYDLNPKTMRKMRPFAYKQTNIFLKNIVKEVELGVVNNIPPSNIPTGPIHVDQNNKNLLFKKNKLSGVIDFGNFYIGPIIIDLGKIIMWNFCSNKKLDKKLLRQFIIGYEEKRKLTKKEKIYLKKSILYAIYSHIWVDLYHVPLKYVPESWPIFLAESFLPVAKQMEKENFNLGL